MNTRKANLRKLRLPSTGSSVLRNGRKRATETLSNFFGSEQPSSQEAKQQDEVMPSPIEKLNEGVDDIVYNDVMPSLIEKPSEKADAIENNGNGLIEASEEQPYLMPSPIEKLSEEPAEKPKRAARTRLSTFLPKEKRLKPADKPITDFLTKRNSQDFETSIKNIKKAPKPKAKPRPKRQQKIHSAFLKKEKLLLEVTAQHCLLDNINPDDMQLALVLSKSEADVNGVIVLDDDEELQVKDGNAAIKDRLKKFGFRNCESEDYSLLLPSTRKAKWANKFTPLTLRNHKRQLEKLTKKVEEFLATQFVSSEPMEADETWRYSVKSHTLIPLSAEDDTVIRADFGEESNVVDFYVLNLFEPSTTKAGHLLKNVHSIPGRDRTPERRKLTPKGETLDTALQSPATKKIRYDDSVISSAVSLTCPNGAPKTPIDREDSFVRSLHASIDFQLNNNFESALCSIDNSIVPKCLSKLDSNEHYCETNCDTAVPLTTPEPLTNSGSCSTFTRATSPDIFADSDQEMDTGFPDGFDEMEKLQLSMSSSSDHHITTYEAFSSDEVKTFSATENVFKDADKAIIDLMQCTSDSSSQPFSAPLQSLQDLNLESDLPCTFPTLSQTSKETLSTSTIPKPTQTDQPIQSFQEFEPNPPSTFPTLSRSSEEMPSNFTITNGSMENDPPFHFNASCSFGKATKTNRTCFSFGSSASEEFSKSLSFSKSKTEDSIDLTQNSDVDCIVLSDDEVNYSIRKTDTRLHFNEEEDEFFDNPEMAKENTNGSPDKHEFSILDFVTHTQPLPTQSEEFDLNFRTKSNTSLDSIDLDLSKRSDFGIMEERSPFKTPTKTPRKTSKSTSIKTPSTGSTKCRRTLSESFIGSPIESSAPLKRFSSSSNKFCVLTNDNDDSNRSDFGIMEERSPFKTPTKTPIKTPRKTPRRTPTSTSTKCRKTLSESFIGSPIESTALLKRFSSSSKFCVFTKDNDDSLSDLDDIDKLVYGSPSKKAYRKPVGLDQLLTGAISVPINSPKKPEVESPLKEFEFNGRTYMVRTTNVLPKPNFEAMNESALLDQLYRYGIKPLKRKQAIKILEYVYYQTHPCLVDDMESPSKASAMTKSSKNSSENETEINERRESMAAISTSKFNYKDCWGLSLVSEVNINMEIENEQYILQTNTSKKISTALLPFHIAWYNLVKSNQQLHEAILHYEPVDLQEIYLFFKGIGYRYEPKELKHFFDSRSIIFRYDLNKDPSAGAKRHVRKKGIKATQRNGRTKIS